jgi:hypothetical protein
MCKKNKGQRTEHLISTVWTLPDARCERGYYAENKKNKIHSLKAKPFSEI